MDASMTAGGEGLMIEPPAVEGADSSTRFVADREPARHGPCFLRAKHAQWGGLRSGDGFGLAEQALEDELAQQHIELDARHSYPLQPGMTLSADVLLERRRLVEYLLAPLLGSWPGR